jgi:hypothetical protein
LKKDCLSIVVLHYFHSENFGVLVTFQILEDFIPEKGMKVINEKGWEWEIVAIMVSGQPINKKMDSVNERKKKGQWTIKLEALNHVGMLTNGDLLHVIIG